MVGGRSLSGTFDTAREAQDWEVTTRARFIEGYKPSGLTVRAYAALWLDDYADGRTTTLRFHKFNLVNVLDVIGDKPLTDVTDADISAVMKHTIKRTSVGNAACVYRTVAALFNRAASRKLIAHSPVDSKVHRPKVQPKRKPVWERRHARAVLPLLDGWVRDAAMVQLALGTRFGELAALTTEDVESGWRVVIRRRFHHNGGTIAGTKNRHMRVLTVPEVVRPIFTRRMTAVAAMDPRPIPELGEDELDARPWDGSWLLQTSTGRPASLTAFNRALKAACVEAGAPVLSSHGLRHTYVSWMIDEGFTTDQIASWVGDEVRTVQKVYAHMLEASSDPAADAMSQWLGGMDDENDAPGLSVVAA